jgi:HEAT repeat protein
MWTEAEAQEDRLLVDRIREKGLSISSVWDLVHTREAYPEAISVLIEMLPKLKEISIREGVIRALTVKEAAPAAARPLIDEFYRLLGNNTPQGSTTRWAIANALTVVARADSVDAILQLIALPASECARQMLALTLGKLKDRRAVPILVELLEDDQVVGHAASALGMLKAPEARAALLERKNHPRTWVRKEVEKAILKIDGKPVTRKAQLKIN